MIMIMMMVVVMMIMMVVMMLIIMAMMLLRCEASSPPWPDNCSLVLPPCSLPAYPSSSSGTLPFNTTLILLNLL